MHGATIKTVNAQQAKLNSNFKHNLYYRHAATTPN